MFKYFRICFSKVDDVKQIGNDVIQIADDIKKSVNEIIPIVNDVKKEIKEVDMNKKRRSMFGKYQHHVTFYNAK